MPEISDSSYFPTTRWSLVRQLHSPDGRQVELALDGLCQAYYAPLYAYGRACGLPPDDAGELVQDFFVHVLGNDAFHTLEQHKGQLRGWMVRAFTNRLHSQRTRQKARKRGGRAVHVELDFALAEEQYSRHFTQNADPVHVCDHLQARALWDATLEYLDHDPRIQKRASIYAALRPHILTGWPAGGPNQERVAAQLGISANVLKTRLFNLSAKAREVFSKTARQTLDPAMSGEEVEYLWRLLL